MSSRIEILESLLNLEKPIGEITDILSKFEWDSDELVILHVDHIIKVLERYLSGELNEVVVEAWANAIECRDDIGLYKGCEKSLKDVIYELANPLLTQNLTHRHARNLILRLAKYAGQRT